jgi:hypothetical protein
MDAIEEISLPLPKDRLSVPVEIATLSDGEETNSWINHPVSPAASVELALNALSAGAEILVKCLCFMKLELVTPLPVGIMPVWVAIPAGVPIGDTP